VRASPDRNRVAGRLLTAAELYPLAEVLRVELKQRIMAYPDNLNREPVVHTWSYKITVPA
jgi:hypothetical protein